MHLSCYSVDGRTAWALCSCYKLFSNVFLINRHFDNLQLLKVNKAVNGYSTEALLFLYMTQPASTVEKQLPGHHSVVSKRKMPNSLLACTWSCPLSEAGGLCLILCLDDWRLWIWLLSSLRLSILFVWSGYFLPVDATKICNKHNWVIYSASPVSSC